MSEKERDHNPRYSLEGDHFGRTFALLDLAEEKRGHVEHLLGLIGDCFPFGDNRDLLGATTSQMMYIGDLAKLERDDLEELVVTVLKGGGISSGQASHMISRLKGTGPAK